MRCSIRSSTCGRATRAGVLRTDFQRKLGKISYHVPCHLRVQNLGLKTRDVLMLVPETQVEPIERCSGHNGTYGVKREYREASMKIGRPVVRRVADSGADFYSSDCPMAGHQIESGLGIRAAAAARADPSAEAAADGLRNMNAMNRTHLTRKDLMSLEQYSTRAQGIPRESARAQAQPRISRSGRTPPGRSRTG